jgi:hypothetical protein
MSPKVIRIDRLPDGSARAWLANGATVTFIGSDLASQYLKTESLARLDSMQKPHNLLTVAKIRQLFNTTAHISGADLYRQRLSQQWQEPLSKINKDQLQQTSSGGQPPTA